MKILGIEFSSSDMNYVAISREGDAYEIAASNRMVLGDTRDRDSLMAFQNAAKTLLNDVAPDLIAIKEKPETGKMRAGAASLKMEGIVVANAPCPVEFISGRSINKTSDEAPSLFGYLQPAFKAAVAALTTKSV